MLFTLLVFEINKRNNNSTLTVKMEDNLLGAQPTVAEIFKLNKSLKKGLIVMIIFGVLGIGLGVYLPFTECGSQVCNCYNFRMACFVGKKCYCCFEKDQKYTCGDSHCYETNNIVGSIHVCTFIAIPMGVCLLVSIILGVILFIKIRKIKKGANSITST